MKEILFLRCQILQKLGIPPGTNFIKRTKQVDSLRIRKAKKAIDEIEKKVPPEEDYTQEKTASPGRGRRAPRQPLIWNWDGLKVGHKICFS